MNILEIVTRSLVENGAVLQTWNSPTQTYLVGELHWLDASRLFWFTAHGDRADDGHVLEFDAAHEIDGTIEFFRHGRRIGRLSTIATAAVDDPEDFSVAFSIWRQVQPCVRPLIDDCRARYERQAALN